MSRAGGHGDWFVKLAYLLRFLSTSCEPLFQTFGGVQWRTQNQRSLPMCKQDEGRIDSQSATSSSDPFFGASFLLLQSVGILINQMSAVFNSFFHCFFSQVPSVSLHVQPWAETVPSSLEAIRRDESAIHGETKVCSLWFQLGGIASPCCWAILKYLEGTGLGFRFGNGNTFMMFMHSFQVVNINYNTSLPRLFVCLVGSSFAADITFAALQHWSVFQWAGFMPRF